MRGQTPQKQLHPPNPKIQAKTNQKKIPSKFIEGAIVLFPITIAIAI